MEMQPTPETTTEEIIVVENEPSTALKVIVLIALIGLLIVGILLPIKLVPTAVSTAGDKIASFFGGSSSVILSTDTQDIVSGSAFKLSWSGTHQTDGAYVISYACASGITLETSINQPNERIGCGTLYFFSPKDNSIEITPISTNTTATAVVTLSFMKSGASSPSKLGAISLTINNQDANAGLIITTSTSTTPVTTPAPTPSPTPKPTQTSNPSTGTTYASSNPNGTPDLSVVIESVGYLDPTTSQFVPSQYITPGERAAVKFRITNVGTKSTGTWSFSASLPSAARPHYTSYNQQSLNPGASIDYTLGFDGINGAEDNIVTITASINSGAAELSRANNTATTHIFNPQGSNNPYGNVSGSDLGVSIISAGTIDPYSGALTPSTTFTQNSRIGVQFKVTNNGTTASGSWNFIATLPIIGQNSQYISQYQNSLAPGQSTVMTLTFSNLQSQGQNTFSVVVNPSTSDANQSNNQASITLYQY